MSSIQTQNTSSGGRNNRQSTTWTNNNNNNTNNNQSKPRPRPQGDCAELKHNVFDLNGSGAIDKFNKSLEALLNYITSNQTGGQDVVNMLDNDEEPDWMDDAHRAFVSTTKLDWEENRKVGQFSRIQRSTIFEASKIERWTREN